MDALKRLWNKQAAGQPVGKMAIICIVGFIIGLVLGSQPAQASGPASLIRISWGQTTGPYLVHVSNSMDGPWFTQYYIGDGESHQLLVGAPLCFKVTDATGAEWGPKCADPSQGDQEITWTR